MEELVVPDSSNTNWLALIALVLASATVLRSSRSNAVTAVLLTALFIPLGQQLVVLGLHFRFYRILILIGIVRVLVRKDDRQIEERKTDRLFLAWALMTMFCGVLRGPRAETFGVAYDAIGTYFLFRYWIHDRTEVVQHLRILAVASVVLAVFMGLELATRRNLFSALGGVPEITLERDGRFRCQGPFRHPILAGTFTATLFPLMIALWFDPGSRRRAVIALVTCAFCTYAAASSGALLTLLGAVAGLALWPMREQMRWVRRGSVLALAALVFVMDPPVWFLISRISELVGGTGWYRSHLIDQAVNHLGEWWLYGSSKTAHWAGNMFHVLPMDPENIDITNHYIEQGLKGGLLGLALFLMVIARTLGSIGCSVRSDAAAPRWNPVRWSFGVAVFAHCTAFISVSYFDQILVFWFWVLAAVPALVKPTDLVPEMAQREYVAEASPYFANV